MSYVLDIAATLKIERLARSVDVACHWSPAAQKKKPRRCAFSFTAATLTVQLHPVDCREHIRARKYTKIQWWAIFSSYFDTLKFPYGLGSFAMKSKDFCTLVDVKIKNIHCVKMCTQFSLIYQLMFCVIIEWTAVLRLKFKFLDHFV